ncbi:unnamed protein product, partial [Effrenium voratum]
GSLRHFFGFGAFGLAMPQPVSTVRIVGYGMTALGKLRRSATELMQEALQKALQSTGLQMKDLDGLVAVPSLSHPHFMEAHFLATQVGLLPRQNVRVRTIDTGGAGPVSGLLEAVRMVKAERCQAVAVVAGDAVSSLATADFLARADQGCRDPQGLLPSPCIPNGYDQVARWQMGRSVSREQLAMVSVLMSRQAQRHPLALTKRPHSLEDVLSSRSIAPATNLLECARRADGGAAIIVASSSFMDHHLGHDVVSSKVTEPLVFEGRGGERALGPRGGLRGRGGPGGRRGQRAALPARRHRRGDVQLRGRGPVGLLRGPAAAGGRRLVRAL